MNKTKIGYISYLQSFALFITVLGHSFPKNPITEEMSHLGNVLVPIIYSFHMPLFFTISGFLFYYSKNSNFNFKQFFIKKFKRLIIPYVSLGSLAYLIKAAIFNKVTYKPIELSIDAYIESIIYPHKNPDGFLWFLPTIFIIFIISYFVLNKKEHINFALAASAILSLISRFIDIELFNIKEVTYYLFFFISGYFINKNKDKIFQIIMNRKFISVIILIYISLYCLHNKLLRLPLALCGIVISFYIALVSTNNNKKFLWGVLDDKYYQIYLLSWFMLVIPRRLFQSGITNYYTSVALMFLSGLFLPILITFIIKKYFPKLKILIGF